MDKLIQAIKGSRAIVILLIIYVAITITVVVLDRSMSNKKDSSSSNNTKENKNNNDNNTNNETDKELTSFIDEVYQLYEVVDDYVVTNNLITNQCIPLSNIFGQPVDGSVLLYENGTKYFVWYGNGKYVINGVELTNKKIKSSDVSTSYNTPDYNTCGTKQ